MKTNHPSVPSRREVNRKRYFVGIGAIASAVFIVFAILGGSAASIYASDRKAFYIHGIGNGVEYSLFGDSGFVIPFFILAALSFIGLSIVYHVVHAHLGQAAKKVGAVAIIPGIMGFLLLVAAIAWPISVMNSVYVGDIIHAALGNSAVDKKYAERAFDYYAENPERIREAAICWNKANQPFNPLYQLILVSGQHGGIGESILPRLIEAGGLSPAVIGESENYMLSCLMAAIDANQPAIVSHIVKHGASPRTDEQKLWLQFRLLDAQTKDAAYKGVPYAELEPLLRDIGITSTADADAYRAKQAVDARAARSSADDVRRDREANAALLLQYEGQGKGNSPDARDLRDRIQNQDQRLRDHGDRK